MRPLRACTKQVAFTGAGCPFLTKAAIRTENGRLGAGIILMEHFAISAWVRFQRGRREGRSSPYLRLEF